MPDITQICRAAWNDSRKAHQPEYDELIESYRTMLTARAEGVLAADSVSEDAPFQAFENGVLSQSKDAITTIDDITPHKVEEPEPIHLESRGYAEIVPGELSDLEATGTIAVNPEEKSATVNVEKVVKKSAKKRAAPKTIATAKKAAAKKPKAAKKVAPKK